jgi:hypothetical protein
MMAINFGTETLKLITYVIVTFSWITSTLCLLATPTQMAAQTTQHRYTYPEKWANMDQGKETQHLEEHRAIWVGSAEATITSLRSELELGCAYTQ